MNVQATRSTVFCSRAGSGRAGGTQSRWRRFLFATILVEIAAVALFVAATSLGEQWRPTRILLYLPRLPLLAAVLAGAVVTPATRRRVPLLVAVHLILGLVVLFPVMGLAVGAPRATERPIRLASYNVFFGTGGRPALVDEIVAMPSDIVVLQAAFGSLGEELRERLPDRTIRQEGEFVIVSKFAVREVEVPPRLDDGTPAMFVEYVVDAGTMLRLVSVHPYSPRHAIFGEQDAGDDVSHREGQIEAAVAAARSDVQPFIVAGDTNLPALSAIARRHFSGLTDAFADVGFGFGYTFPAKRPWMRIDRVLGSEGVRFADVRVGPRGASDHRPLFVDFALTTASGGGRKGSCCGR